MPNSEACRIADLSSGLVGILQFQHSEVGTEVATRQRSGHRAPVRKSHSDFLIALDGMVSGDDHPRTPEDAARGNARPGVDGYNRAAGPLDRSGQRSEEHTYELQSLRHLVC